MFNFEQIKQQIDYEYNYGIRDFEITGGEPSEHKYLRLICEYIKSKNSNSKIAIITNGGLHACNVWDVIDEVLVSYHLGRNDKNYDTSIFPYGTTYSKVKSTIDTAIKSKKLVRTNTVIGTFNIKGIKYILDDLVEFHPSIVNFLPLNVFDDAYDMGKYINYDELRPILKSAIDFLNEKLPTSLKFIRYMPFCGMEGYEQYIVNSLQHIYDWFDWNVELNGVNVIEYSKQKKCLGRYGSTSIDAAINSINAFYEKTSQCTHCRYLLICDGVEKNNSLTKYIMPMSGSIIKNIMFYLQTATYDFYKKWYNI